MKKSVAIFLALALAGIGGLLYWLAPDSNDTLAANDLPAPAATAAAGAAEPAHQAPASFTTGVEGLPASLQGTDVDGELEVDANGHLKITGGIRRLFDYFLSAVGEEPIETILKRIRAYIRHKLPSEAAAEAERLLDSYVGYKKALEAIPEVQASGNRFDVAALRQQKQQVQALRNSYFSPEVITAFFGDEDVYDNYTLARLEVMQNKDLSASQRAQQLAALQSQLPPQMQEQIKTITQAQNLETLTEDWKKRGGSAAELRQIRENLVGPEAADRLETLDKERASWDQRMDSWYSQRAAILNNQSLSEQDKQSQLDQLRNSQFSETERLRVQALERMHDRGEVVGR